MRGAVSPDVANEPDCDSGRLRMRLSTGVLSGVRSEGAGANPLLLPRSEV
jgi:hypothetical protein